jgi:hypothetical protein
VSCVAVVKRYGYYRRKVEDSLLVRRDVSSGVEECLNRRKNSKNMKKRKVFHSLLRTTIVTIGQLLVYIRRALVTKH